MLHFILISLSLIIVIMLHSKELESCFIVSNFYLKNIALTSFMIVLKFISPISDLFSAYHTYIYWLSNQRDNDIFVEELLIIVLLLYNKQIDEHNFKIINFWIILYFKKECLFIAYLVFKKDHVFLVIFII